MFKLRLYESRKKFFQEMVDELVRPLEAKDSDFFTEFKQFMSSFERLTAYAESFFEADYHLKLQKSTYVPVEERKTTTYYSEMMFHLLNQVDKYEKKCNLYYQKMIDSNLFHENSRVKNLNTHYGDSSLYYNMYYIYILTLAKNTLMQYNNYKKVLINNRKAGEVWSNAQKSYLSFQVMTNIFNDIKIANIYKFMGEEHLKKGAGDSYQITYQYTPYFVSYIARNMLKDFYTYSKDTKDISTTKIAYDRMREYVYDRKKVSSSHLLYKKEILKTKLYRHIPCGIMVQKKKGKIKK